MWTTERHLNEICTLVIRKFWHAHFWAELATLGGVRKWEPKKGGGGKHRHMAGKSSLRPILKVGIFIKHSHAMILHIFPVFFFTRARYSKTRIIRGGWVREDRQLSIYCPYIRKKNLGCPYLNNSLVLLDQKLGEFLTVIKCLSSPLYLEFTVLHSLASDAPDVQAIKRDIPLLPPSLPQRSKWCLQKGRRRTRTGGEGKHIFYYFTRAVFSHKKCIIDVV